MSILTLDSFFGAGALFCLVGVLISSISTSSAGPVGGSEDTQLLPNKEMNHSPKLKISSTS
jgi:hypothetical protein